MLDMIEMVLKFIARGTARCAVYSEKAGDFISPPPNTRQVRRGLAEQPAFLCGDDWDCDTD